MSLSAYTYKIYNNVSEINKNDWDAVIQQSSGYTFLSYEFISTAEKTFEAPNKLFYVLIYHNERAIACTTFSSFSVDLTLVAGNTVKKLVGGIRKLFPSFLQFKTMFCGLPVSAGQRPIVCPGQKHFDQVLALVDELLNKTSKKEKTWINIYKEVGMQEKQSFDQLTKGAYTRVVSLPIYHWNYRFSSFDEYLGTLKSRYRSNIKRAKKKFIKGGFKIITTNDSQKIQELYTKEVHQLYLAVNAKSNNRLEVLSRSFFLNLAQEFGKNAHFIFALDKEDKVVGFASCIHNKNSFHCLFCGMDYKINNQYNIYYNLIYSCLKKAIELKSYNIEVGQTADEFKTRLSCTSDDLYVYGKFNSKIGNFFLKKFSKYLIQERPDFNHQTFKQNPVFTTVS